jgi:RNA polymerase sigma-70 factor (ECF subfamily)
MRNVTIATVDGDRTRDEAVALMQRYACGDDAAFERFYALTSPRLYRFCRRLSLHDSDADDVFQETYLRVHRARSTYLPGADPLHWAFAIARSVSIDRHRRRCRRREHADAGASASQGSAADARYDPEVHARAHDLAELVTRELHRMSEKNRVAYVLLREEELSVREAAAVLGTTPTAVKQRAHRAYEQLRAAVARAGWQTGDDGGAKVESPRACSYA